MITVVGNLKGGTGKSTIAYNLAIWLQYQSCQAFVFDFDPQQTLYDLSRLRRSLQITPPLEVDIKVDNFLRKMRQLQPNQHILVDVGVSDTHAMRLALRYADKIVIPVTPSQADVWATQRFIKEIKQVRRDVSKPVSLLAILNRADSVIEDSLDTELALDSLKSVQRLPLRIHYRSSYRQSLSEALAVFELESQSSAAKEIEILSQLIYKEV